MGKWIRAVALRELPEGQGRRVQVGGRRIALFLVGERVFALDDNCPHEGGFLSAGTLEGGAVRCPVHGARFELGNGRALEPPAGEPMAPPVSHGVQVYPVKLEDGEVHLQL